MTERTATNRRLKSALRRIRRICEVGESGLPALLDDMARIHAIACEALGLETPDDEKEEEWQGEKEGGGEGGE